MKGEFEKIKVPFESMGGAKKYPRRKMKDGIGLSTGSKGLTFGDAFAKSRRKKLVSLQKKSGPTGGSKKKRKNHNRKSRKSRKSRKHLKSRKSRKHKGGNVALAAAAVPFGLLALKSLLYGKKRLGTRKGKRRKTARKAYQ